MATSSSARSWLTSTVARAARRQPLGDEAAGAQVEMRLGLVQHQQVGIGGQRAGQQDEPPLTARELAHAPRLGHAAQPELAEQVGDQRAVGLLAAESAVSASS